MSMDAAPAHPHSGGMETQFEILARTAFTPRTTYLNTASRGLLPTRGLLGQL